MLREISLRSVQNATAGFTQNPDQVTLLNSTPEGSISEQGAYPNQASPVISR